MKIGLSLLAVRRSMGGNFQYAMDMLDALSGARGNNDLVVFYDHGSLEDEPDFRREGVRHVFVAGDGRDLLGVLRRIPQVAYAWTGIRWGTRWSRGRYAELDRQGCDVIFHPYWKVSAYITETPAIVAVHDCAPREAPETMPFFARHQLDLMIRGITRHAAIILADSHHGSALLTRFYGVDPARIAVIPFRPRAHLVAASNGRTAHVVARHRLAPGFLFLPGRWGSYKNTERVLDAMRVLRERGRAVPPLVLCGLKKHELPLAAAAIAHRGLEGQVHVLGFVPDEDMAGLYASALALVFPTLLGPTSIPVSEAMAAGCPVIVSNISGYAEQVGDAGLLVDPRDVISLAAAIDRVASDAPLRRRLSEAGRRKIRGLLELDYGARFMQLAEAVATRNKGYW